MHGIEPWVLVNPPVTLPDDINTVTTDLQAAVSDVLSAATGTGATPSPVTLSVSSTELNAVVAAVQSLAPNTTGLVATIVVTLADGEYSGQSIAVPAGVRLVIDGTGNSITFEGHLPAFTITSGDVRQTGLTFVNSTDAPTILVRGGSLTLQNSIISETTGGACTAIEITGGTANLGTLTDPGGNTIIVNGSGEFVRNVTANDVPAIGEMFYRRPCRICSSSRFNGSQ
jgi:hypothetical protein